MLSQEEQDEIRREMGRYAQPRGVVTDALKIVQKRRGWVSDDAVRDIAEFLRLTCEEVDQVATFYNWIFRKPVGRHVIGICDSVSCWILGFGSLRDHLCERLGVQPGQTTPDGRFTLLPVACLGACDKAPVMMVDDDLHVELTVEKIDAVLERYE
jgi:NADH-quinone oxidoreductase subunit E